jgi:hypothetical protein
VYHTALMSTGLKSGDWSLARAGRSLATVAPWVGNREELILARADRSLARANYHINSSNISVYEPL